MQIGQRGGIGEGLVGNGLLSGRWLLSGRRLVLAPGLGDGPGLLGQRLQLATSFGEGRVGLAGAVVEPAAHPLVEHRVEEGLEQGLALLGSSPQHLGETPLRQQDHLAELGGIQPQQPLHLAAHLGDVAGNRLLCPGLGLSLSLSLSLRLRLRLRIEPPEGGAGGLGGGALAPAARHLTGRLALHPPTATAGGELEHHPRHLAWGGMVGAQALDAALARHLAVERKAEGVEQVGLARTRAAVDQEQAIAGEGIEVEPHRLGVGPEGLQLQAVGTHQVSSLRPAALRAWRSSCTSAWLGARPCWSL